MADKRDVRDRLVTPGRVVTPEPSTVPAPKQRGRPKRILVARTKVSLWVVHSKWRALQRMVEESGGALTLTVLVERGIDHVIGEDRRRQAKRRRKQGT